MASELSWHLSCECLPEYMLTPITITWVRCLNYDSAKDFSRVIYLHEWNGRPFYWGKAHNSFFGGHKRKQDGLHASGRYNSGYKHWIEGCLQHGGKLYVGRLGALGIRRIDEIEQHLIREYGHAMNFKIKETSKPVLLAHVGDIPDCIAFQRTKRSATSKASKKPRKNIL